MALSAATARKRRSLHLAEKGSGAVKTSTTVYQGSLVSVVEATGRIAPAASGASGVGAAVVGVALETKTGDAAGTVTVEYMFGHQELFTARTALTTTYRMCNVAASDDDQVTTLSAAGTAAQRQIAGTAVDFDSSGNAWVWIAHFSSKSAP